MNYGELSHARHRRTAGCGSVFSTMLLSLSLLSGCATTAPGADPATQLESMLRDADTENAAGRHEKAVSMLNQAAKDHPTSAAPWLKIANIWFDKENYPASILAANEALQREAANQDAKSLLVVSGLRVSAGALTGLRPNGAVNTNTRLEAENLTQSLRNALGEKVLVPSAEVKPASAPQRPKARVRPAASTAPAAAVRQEMPSAGASDPFKSLK